MRPASHYQTADRHPDKSQTSSARRRTPLGLSARWGRAARAAALLALFSAIVTVFHSSASYAWPIGGRAAAYAAPTAVPAAERDFTSAFFAPALFQAAPFESVETYADDCVTPKTAFTLGDTICVKASVPFAFLVGRRSINIIGPANVVRASLGVSGLEQTFSFTIPGTPQTTLGGESFDNRGTWRADLATSGGSRRASADFDVASAVVADAAADLQIVSVVDDGDGIVLSGASLSVKVYILNMGPNPAANVVVTPPTHPGLALQSFAPVSGPACGGATCSIASLAVRGVAVFTAIYDVTGAPGSKIVARSSVTSDTTDPRPTIDYMVDVDNPAPPANTNVNSIGVAIGAPDPNSICMLTCPANVVATANTTVGGQFGALVKYGAASVDGDCGVVSNSPTSNSFFAVGTHTVTSSATGASCTFTVKVLDTPAPTISCPTDKTAIAASGADDATVVVGTPTFTASGTGTITSLRSDSTQAVLDEDGEIVTPAVPKALTDPYPIGVTSIIWTVTDPDGRTASCTQKIIVSENACGSDTTPPTITAPDDITVGTGVGNTGCGVTLDDELGQPQVTDACTVTVSILGLPPGNEFAPGTYTLTYKAKDAAGNEAIDTQVVTVIENTPPVIEAPADATYTCLSAVPAANASQATRGDVFDEDGNPLPPGPPFDNCGVPTVAVSETSTGVGTAASPKVITRTFTATDAAGNTASDVQTITVIDATPPVISCPANITVYLPLNSPATSTVVNYTAPAGSDNCSGATTTRTAGLASGSAFPVGTTTNTYRVVDAVGNTAECSFTVTVLYNFTGFFSPVGNPPVLNEVKGGQNIPLKFSLSGNKGLSIFAAGFPASQQVSCSTNVPINNMEETETPGNSTLTYSPDTYHYNWKSEKAWAGTCRVLTVKLNDGSTHTANFKFK